MGTDPLVYQTRITGCGEACLRMLCTHYNKTWRHSETTLQQELLSGGMSLQEMIDLARWQGISLEARVVLPSEFLEVPTPIIVLLARHYVTVWSINEKIVSGSDPANGRFTETIDAFLLKWSLPFEEVIVLFVSCSD
jgi:ATP-binding cassette subfamily B protein RaxB